MSSEQKRVVDLLAAALECSVYVSPTDAGLTYEELLEVGRRSGFQQGEISDALRLVPTTQEFGRRLFPDGSRVLAWSAPHMPQEPDYRDWDASEFIHTEMRAAVRANGTAFAKLERVMLVERAIARGISKLGVEAAIEIDVLVGHFAEKEGLLSYRPGYESWPLPSEQRKPLSAFNSYAHRSEAKRVAYPVVKDIIDRRTDGRPASIEPLDAFAEHMGKLGHDQLSLWWKQMVAELRQGDVQVSPVSVTVLAAALVEGVLTFVVRHARAQKLPAFASTDFDKPPQSWKIDDLVRSASKGESAAILDNPSRLRAEWLVHARQRIHPGRMLSEYPGGAPDYRPESAREAKAVADMVVRRVLDWLEKYPASDEVPRIS